VAAPAVLFLAACQTSAPLSTVHARIFRGPKDSTAFAAADVAHFCKGNGVLFDAISGANGVLAWVRGPSALTPGTYPLLGRADSSTPRGALVAVRFILHDIAHGFPVDSGVLTLTTAGPTYRARIQGSGTDLGLATKSTVDITIDSIKPRSDTLACGAKE